MNETETEIGNETETETGAENDGEGSAAQGGLSLEDGLERQRREVQRALRASLGGMLTACVVAAW